MTFVDRVTFFSYQQLVDYVSIISDSAQYLPDGTTNPHWLEYYETVVRDTKFNFHYDNQGNYVWDPSYYDVLRSDLATSVGEQATVKSTTSSAAAGGSASAAAAGNSNVGGGGVKTAPVVKTIITDKTTETADPADPAVGSRNFGLDSLSSFMNIVSGIANAFGLANLSINAQNSHVWRDLANNVFDADLPLTATVNEIKSWFHLKMHRLVWWDEENQCVKYTVPKEIVERLYEFFAVHMVESGGSQTAALYLDPLIFSLCVFGAFDPEEEYGWYYKRYFKLLTTAAPNTGYVYFDILNVSDDLFRIQMTDFIATIIGSGFTISDENTASLINSMNGLTETLSDLASYDFSVLNRALISFRLRRGASPPPKSTPISPSEISIDIALAQDQGLIIDTSEDLRRVRCYANTGGLTKYLKRGRDGSNDSDWAYLFNVPRPNQDNYYGYYVRYQVTFPANEMQVAKMSGEDPNTDIRTKIQYTATYVNGYTDEDHTELVPDSGIAGSKGVLYTNFGYRGEGSNYEPDEYLQVAWQRRNNTDKTPNPNKTAEENYTGWLDHMHKLSQPDRSGNHTQTDYVTVNGPAGEDATDRLINHGNVPSADPDAYRNDKSQYDNQNGRIPDNTPIDDINHELQDAIENYDYSRTTPESAPDPIPNPQPDYPDPNPQYPTQPDPDPPGESEDPPDPTVMEGLEASGMVSVYNPTKQQVIDFSGWLWSSGAGSFIDNFLKIFQNPMDAIIGMHILYATPSTGGSDNIRVGFLDSGVASKVVNKQFIEINCGHVFVPEFYGNAIDYEPYTQIHCYLPFVGMVTLKPNDVIGKEVYISYGVDVLTGTCLAMITAKSDKSTILLYTFSGNCAVQVPISGGSYAQMITGLAGMLVSGAGAIATGNPLLALGAGASFLNSHVDVSHSGTIGANAGAMGPRKPFIVVTRKMSYDADNYNDFYGYPANQTVILGTCKGYTKIKSVHIDSIGRATDNEKREIETLLKEGVIIR